jgi:5-methylcytosine-specific restriction endonuclease McrA
MPGHRVNFSRRAIYKRDNNQCQYCGIRPGTELLNIDHVVPRCLGGLTTWENCVIACIECNSKKANKTLEEVKMKLLKKPVKPSFVAVFRSDMHDVPEEWVHFLPEDISEAYWTTELINDNQ